MRFNIDIINNFTESFKGYTKKPFLVNSSSPGSCTLKCLIRRKLLMDEEKKVVNKTFMGFVSQSSKVSPGWFWPKGKHVWFMAKVFCKTILGLLKG